MKLPVYLLMILFLISFTHAATISGKVYDLSLDLAKDVIISIDTEPKQQFISKDGSYSFSVPPGDYVVQAQTRRFDLVESSSSEEISVKYEGIFVLDLILFPEIESDLIDEDIIVSVEDDYFESSVNYLFILSIIILIILILLLIYMKKKIKRLKNEEKEIKTDDYFLQILNIIKENKRVTQKEIRKKIPLSEAKISLIITELEHRGAIEKIKKGRGNVIILKK